MIPLEEKRTVNWFLLFFYIILIGYDFFYYYLFPVVIANENSNFPKFNYINYIVIIVLLPIVVYLNRLNKQHIIKYLYIFCFLLSGFTVDMLTFYGKEDYYFIGNMVEVYFLLSLPLFINTRYFWVVALGITVKYLLTGVILKTSFVITPIILITIFSIMSFFLLVRFQGYVRAIRTSYDNQLEGIVKGVIATLELKDPYTRGHSERVASYALLLIKQFGNLSKDELKSFYYSCLLHDIGKVHISDTILMKPGKLTKEEFEIIKTHPVVGAEAVQNVEGIKDTLCVIRSHHERWDGRGYPDQLKGTEIPLIARVAAIADAFDAMTSSRSYRAAMPVEEAYNRIIEGKGSQFDPMLVEEFVEIYPAWVEFHQKYPWTEKWELLKEVES